MSMNTMRFAGFQRLAEQVSIDLFNNIVTFVIDTTEMDTSPLRNELRDHLWYQRDRHTDIGFRYLGELLERYREKWGDGVRELRAIALALGTVAPIATNNMFVGAQRRNFERKLRQLAKKDVYLMLAVALLERNTGQSRSAYEKIAGHTYEHAEEILLAMSLFEDFTDAYRLMKGQLLPLLGEKRTVDAIGNADMFAWITSRLARTIKQDRAKDTALPRSLCALGTSHVKEGSKHRDVLLGHGYSLHEIVYLNHAVLRSSTEPNKLLYGSIVEERIAIDLALTLLGSEAALPEHLYGYLASLLDLHFQFDVKLQGHDGLYEAIHHNIQLRNATTLLWLRKWGKESNHYRYKNDVLRFDPRDTKWDTLATALPLSEYRKLFGRQLLRLQDALSRESIDALLKRFEALTGASFMGLFSQYDTQKLDVFLLLSSHGLIDVNAMYNDALKEGQTETLCYVASYIEGIRDRPAYDFLKGLLEANDMITVIRTFGNHFRLTSGLLCANWNSSYHRGAGPTFTIVRDFLTTEEHATLIAWMNEYVYLAEPEHYASFVSELIKAESLFPFIPFEERRAYYLRLVKTAPSTVRGNEATLRKLYLTDAERQEIQREAERLEREKAEREVADQVQKIEAKFREKYDGTIQSLLDAVKLYNHSYYKQECAHILGLALVALDVSLEAARPDYDDALLAMQLVIIAAQRHAISGDTFSRYINLFTEVIVHDEHTQEA